MILWLRMSSFSYTSPMMLPPVRIWPSRTPGAARYANLRVVLSAATSTPSGTNGDWPAPSKMTSSGRWMPSKMFSMMPGPSSTDSGASVRSMASPVVSPDVSS